MTPPSNDDAGSPADAKGLEPVRLDVAPVASATETFDAIAVEGEQERWRAAKVTARAVFKKPALVTPRRMALLGDEGLGVFVNEVRSLAQAMILNERRKLEDRPALEEMEVAAETRKREAAPPPPRKKPRRPAPFKLTRRPEPSALQRLARGLHISPTVQQFVTDAVVWSASAAVFLAGSIALARFVFLTLH